jgi:mono/diheme cytochrome c family protein
MANRTVAILVGSVLVLGVGITVWKFVGASAEPTQSKVNVPKLSDQAAVGKKHYDANCAQCHGPNGAGTGNGPPFIHDVYNPGHHSDRAFYLAAKRGVRRHHWNFGDMPPQPRVSRSQIESIVRYVRELQRANGILYRPHRM